MSSLLVIIAIIAMQSLSHYVVTAQHLDRQYSHHI